MLRLLPLSAVCFSATMLAQQSGAVTIGTVSTAQAEVSGTVSVKGTTAEIQTGGNVHAGNTPADIVLTRGGHVTVCSNSTVALSQSNSDKAPLLVAVQRGAAELKWNAGAHDVVITSDLRFDLSNAAPLDLRIRVTPSGDTCVENRGKDAPVLHVTEQIGVGGYFIKPDQRVLFEHGSLQEVVDRESSNCGCPPAPVLAGNHREPHPFPEAIAQGLEEPKVPQAEPGVEHTSIATNLSYNGNKPAPAAAPNSPAAAINTIPPDTAPSRPAAITRPFRAVGRFFKRVFTR